MPTYPAQDMHGVRRRPVRRHHSAVHFGMHWIVPGGE